MTTLKNTLLCVLATIIAAPIGAFLTNLAIDALVWLAYFAESITSALFYSYSNNIGWIIISASISRVAVPFVGASKIVEVGNGSKYTWPPAVSFFLFSMFFAVHNVYFLMNVVSNN